MSSARIFLDEYAKRRPIGAFLAHFGWWGLAARLGSAAHRLGAPAAVAREPVASLERLLAAIESGAAGEDLLDWSLTGS